MPLVGMTGVRAGHGTRRVRKLCRRGRALRVVHGVVALSAILSAVPARADQTVSLAKRQFAAGSPAMPFQQFLTDARRLAASTTPAWAAGETDLSAWGPALVFPLLERGVSTDAVLGLAAPLEAAGTAPVLLFRTFGLYAAKSRVAFADTPELLQAIRRNLKIIEHATSDLDTFTAGAGMSGWGSVGAGAWLAYLELLYRDYGELGDPDTQRWNADGVRVVDELLQRALLPDGKGFRRDPREEALTLWPNVLALYALMKAYENVELVTYESAAIATVQAIDPLRADDGSYYSTAANAEKDPRANAYLAGALLGLFKDTGDTQYRDRAVAILRWLISGAAAAETARDAALSTHASYLLLLLDSLATQPADNMLGRRPMITAVELSAPSGQQVDAMAARLRPAGFRFQKMFDAVLHTLIDRVPRRGGAFAYDHGDTPGYAAEVLLSAGDRVVAPQIVEREEHLLSWPRPRDLGEISFGAAALLAALEHPEAADAAAAERALRRYLLLSGSMAIADRYYFDWLDWLTNGGGFDYGPTVLGAQVAFAHLAYAQRVHDGAVAGLVHPLAIGRSLIDGADSAAWDDARHLYRARPDSDEVWLLPNAMMVLDLLRAHHLTAEARYLDRAEIVMHGLDALWDEDRGAYFASSGQMGDNAYQSLSTNSYAALAHVRLYEATHDAAHRARALRIFDFIARDLYADGIIYHHLYRGRRATGDIWCSGCNWRVLSALMEFAKQD
jgi:hypothetical protein